MEGIAESGRIGCGCGAGGLEQESCDCELSSDCDTAKLKQEVI